MDIQPSTTRNLAAMAGDAHTAFAYGNDVVDLLSGPNITVDEGDITAAAVAVALQPASRSVDEVGALVALDSASHAVAATLAEFRGWKQAQALDRITLAAAIRDALVFQLTDIDEQD